MSYMFKYLNLNHSDVFVWDSIQYLLFLKFLHEIIEGIDEKEVTYFNAFRVLKSVRYN